MTGAPAPRGARAAAASTSRRRRCSAAACPFDADRVGALVGVTNVNAGERRGRGADLGPGAGAVGRAVDLARRRPSSRARTPRFGEANSIGPAAAPFSGTAGLRFERGTGVSGQQRSSRRPARRSRSWGSGTRTTATFVAQPSSASVTGNRWKLRAAVGRLAHGAPATDDHGVGVDLLQQREVRPACRSAARSSSPRRRRSAGPCRIRRTHTRARPGRRRGRASRPAERDRPRAIPSDRLATGAPIAGAVPTVTAQPDRGSDQRAPPCRGAFHRRSPFDGSGPVSRPGSACQDC